MREAGIPTAVHYPVALHLQPAFSSLREQLGLGTGSFPHAERAAERVLSLPMHPYLTPADIQRVTDAVKAALHQTAVG